MNICRTAILFFFTFLGTIQIKSAPLKNKVYLDPVLPLKEQLVKNSTVYYINDLFDLEGDTLFVPKNSAILFCGGTFLNGTVYGNNTRLEGDVRCYTNILGTYKNKIVKTNWFIKREESDNLCKTLTQLIQTNIETIIINKGNYVVSSTIPLKDHLSIMGEEDVVIELNRPIIRGEYILFSYNIPSQKKQNNKKTNISFNNISFRVNGSGVEGRTSIFRFTNASYVEIDNCSFIDSVDYNSSLAPYSWSMIEFYNCRNCSVTKCHTEYVRLVGSYNGFNLMVSDNEGYNSHGTWLECNDGSGNKFINNHICGNILPKNSTVSQNAKNGIIRNNVIEVYDVESDSMINLGHDSTSTYSNSPRGCIVQGNILKTNICKGIVVWGNDPSNIKIINNTIESSGSWCIITLGDSREILIDNNTIIIGNDGAKAIACHSEKSIIRNNRISSSKQGSTDNAILVASYVQNTCRVYKNKYLPK